MQAESDQIMKYQVYKYQFKIVNITILVDMTPIGDSVYAKGDKLKLPLWYAELLHNNGFVEIEEYMEFENKFIEIISDQSLNKKNIIKIPHDFYLQCYQYIQRLTKNAKKKSINQLNSFISLRKQIITHMALLGESEMLMDKMTLDEKDYFKTCISKLNKIASPISVITKRLKEDGFDE